MNLSELKIGKAYSVGYRRQKGVLVSIKRIADYKGRPKTVGEFRLEDGTVVEHSGKEVPFTWEEQEAINAKNAEQRAESERLEAEAQAVAEKLRDALRGLFGEDSKCECTGYSYRKEVRVSLNYEQAGILSTVLDINKVEV